MNAQTPDERLDIGFVGVGSMGGPMARNLIEAGHAVSVYDIRQEAMEECVRIGGRGAEDAADAAAEAEFVLTSLRSSAIWVEVTEGELLPAARQGQIFIDLGTSEVSQTRRLASEFAKRGAALIDSPVSGGPGGAESGTLRMFIGGEKVAVDRAQPIFDILGDPDHTAYCGESGAGQIVKGVNQLAMGLGNAAYMEAVAYALLSGVDADSLIKGVGGEGGWRGEFAAIAGRIAAGEGESLYVKFPELRYFLDHAEDEQFSLPLTEALYEFCNAGSKEFRDNMNRPAASFWHELRRRGTFSDEPC